ncbi:Prephenate dehydrogenase [Atribacter laminatus]|jgi:prephenate dehydrogenase|uniref:Prephenate dehydrogenase n=1 Tax=Atribacter laminatus TaxID=2847778 RepID=A0A7T1ANZ6_ATRLM|nr:Prephenate dehydrogenase [Atribacter laminatus]
MFGEPGFFLTAQEHDRICALVSHLPHVIANVYASQVYEKDYSFSQLAGSSFRDFTRIAGSSPEVWLDIFLTNQAQILSFIDELEEGIRIMKEIIKSGDVDGLKAFLTKVKKLKERIDGYDSL